ncbi:alpha/beta hydrolase [Rhizobium sp. YIM 134829]|uniref:alpha/beta hydrolase n=1 Tax=Rhizobium sp. YIM 134829 TaxID=3390453 RepID=UPI00397CCADA
MARRSLVIFLHGIGASGAQLMPLASAWRGSLPDTVFAAPDAPFHRSYGHEWFRVDGALLDPRRLQAARDAFDKTIEDVLERQGFARSDTGIAFVGVSQGAIVALDAVASGRWPVAALVSFAGLLAPGRISSDSKQTSILLVHGTDDRTIPSVASTSAADRLRSAGFKVELHLEPGVGHTISTTGAQLALGFLRQTLPR